MPAGCQRRCGGSSEPLSDKLARSKGVICPPAGVMVASYLEKAIDLEIMAADEPDPKLKASLLQIVAAYRKLAHERAARLKAQPSLQSK